MTSHGGAAIPLGYDFGLLDERFLSVESLQEVMTGEQFDQMLAQGEFDLHSPADSFSSHITWEAAKSPGSLRPSHGTSSRSPGTGSSLILTPSSTQRDYHGDAVQPLEDPETENQSTSPDSNISQLSDDYVHINVFGDDASSGGEMSNRPPPHSGSGSNSGSGVVEPSSARYSRLSSIAHSMVSEPSHNQWASFPSVPSGVWMDQTNSSQLGQLNIPANLALNDDAIAATESYHSNLLADIGSFDNSTGAEFTGSLPLRGIHDVNDAFMHDTYLHSSPFAPHFPPAYPQNIQQQHFVTPQQRIQHQSARQDLAFASTDHMYSQQNIPLSSQYQPRPTAQRNPSGTRQVHGQRMMVATASMQSAPHRNRSTPYPQPGFQTPLLSEHVRHVPQQLLQTQPSSSVVGPSVRPLQPAVAGPSRVISSSEVNRSKKGGRSKNSHLPTGTREKSHKMRKAGACWRCALQRDTCPDEGTPCQRCLDREQKGSLTFFGCNRSKLPDFVHDFLPPSMTFMHQKQTIEDCVGDQVCSWDLENSIDVFFTSGYGPALRWKLCEFTPKTNELLVQYQYLQDVKTGRCERKVKYSPPLGLSRLDTSDDAYFDKYLNDLLEPHHLKNFGETCFEEETQVDDFQASLMDLICGFYVQTPQGSDLHEILAKVIRMMVVTYIMGHTLTLVQETLYGVLETIKYSTKPAPADILNMTHTSPRLANRQLKFFFCCIRTQMIERILVWSQQTLHSSGKKEATWLPSLCVMLCLAMTVEELQRTLHIQADAKASKREMSEEAADIEATNACERMDGDFELMVGLFQCKYRDKTWGADGSFGTGTPTLRDQASVSFLHQLHRLMLNKREHLERRRNITLHKDNQCYYTSRLVARFLLPFLNLPT